MFKRTLGAIVVCLVCLCAWAFWIEPASLRTVERKLALPRWPETCSGLRVAVLTDLHVGSAFNGIENLKRIVGQTQQAGPDLILLPGDFVIQGVLGGSFVDPEDAARILATLQAPLGVFAVLGNHDRWLSAPRVEAALEHVGIRVLEDAAAMIKRGACRFNLVGVSDYREGPHDLRRALGSIDPNAASLLFTHNPDLFPEVPAFVALTIAGHTHGGQVWIPLIGRPIVPSEYGQRYAIGHVQESGKHLYVSPGVGTSIVPVRFLVPPEITILNISPAH